MVLEGNSVSTQAPHLQTLIPVPAELCSDRLRLRPLQRSDAPAIFSAINESRHDLEAWLDWPANVTSVANVEDFCVRSSAEWLLRTELRYGIFSRENDNPLGATGLHQLDWKLRTFEIGYWLRTSATGQGYAREAVETVVSMAFSDLHARRVEIRCDPQNERSRRVAERLGFVLEGRLRKVTHTPTGHPRDTLVFSLIDDDRLTALG